MSQKILIDTTTDLPASQQPANILSLHVRPIAQHIRTYGPPIILITILIIAWEAFVRLWHIPAWLLPPPTHIATTLLEDTHLIVTHTQATLLTTLLGFALSLTTGLTLALIVDASPLIRRAIYPLLIFSQTMPIVAIAPLLVVGFGFGLLPKILVVALVTFFPIVINTVDGLQSSDDAMIQLMRAMNATRWQQLWLLRIPMALPFIFSGLKIAITYSVIGAVLAEWIGAKAGIGVYIARSLRAFRTDQVFVAILATSCLTLVLFALTLVIERWLTPWIKR